MSEKQRNKFSAKFKAKVALEAIRGDKTLNEICQEFGVHPSQVGLWKREIIENAPGIFDTKREPKRSIRPRIPRSSTPISDG